MASTSTDPSDSRNGIEIMSPPLSSENDDGSGQELSQSPRAPARHILDMPSDIFFHLNKYIENEDLVLLAATCRSLRNLCHPGLNNLGHAITQLSTIRRDRFMTTLSRSSYTHWVCGHCRMLHRIFEMDLPGCPRDIVWRRSECHYNNHVGRITCDPYSPIVQSQLAFHHIQIALRFTRLMQDNVPDNDSIHRTVPYYLRARHQRPALSTREILWRIMYPPNKTVTRRLGVGGYGHAVAISQQFHRKAIPDTNTTFLSTNTNRPQLRFVQQSTIEIRRLVEVRFCWPTVVYKICPHLNISSRHVNYGGPDMSGSQYFASPSHQFALDYVLYAILTCDTSRKWSVIQGDRLSACRKCLTDYQILFDRDDPSKITVRIWQDFGPECCTFDAHDWDSQKGYDYYRCSLPALYFSTDTKRSRDALAGRYCHIPGDVAAFYFSDNSNNNINGMQQTVNLAEFRADLGQ